MACYNPHCHFLTYDPIFLGKRSNHCMPIVQSAAGKIAKTWQWVVVCRLTQQLRVESDGSFQTNMLIKCSSQSWLRWSYNLSSPWDTFEIWALEVWNYAINYFARTTSINSKYHGQTGNMITVVIIDCEQMGFQV